MTDEKFTIYTSTSVPNCPYCQKAKALLNERGLAYSEKVIGKDITRKDFLAQHGASIRTVPQILVDGRRIGGYDALLEYLSQPKGHW